MTSVGRKAADCDPRNGNGYNTDNGNALMIAALLQPEALTEAIMRAVQATMPMPKLELEKRRVELTNQIDELSYVVAALLDKVGALPDPLMAPWLFLGVKLTKDETANEKAALAHVLAEAIRA